MEPLKSLRAGRLRVASGRGWRVVSCLLQGSLTWLLLVLTMIGNVELEGGSLGKQPDAWIMAYSVKHIQSSAEVGLTFASHMME